uniref:protein disulfide-isomerase n=1 Tax=Scleropages formosus TaxID=113540 RepID=A0A8C9W6X1_SCLFO
MNHCFGSCFTMMIVFFLFFYFLLIHRFKETRKDDVWLVDFYAPWCGYCKKLEPVWREVGAELRSSGSPVRVGMIDATAHTGVAAEFAVRGYPTIKLFKGDLSYNYKGPRTKDAIIEFANRVAGPVVRPLPSKQMFEHIMKRHDVLFVYVGGDSTLKDKYIEVASEQIINTYFFSASEEVLPEVVTLNEVPAVVVFKDGAYFVYDGESCMCLIFESVTLGKVVAMFMSVLWFLVDLFFTLDFQFGYMDGNDYINSLIMGEVTVPSIIILNASNEQYFLPSEPVETMEQLIHFMNSVLDGTSQAQGGDNFFQRLKRLAYDGKSTVMSVFRSSPILGCFLFGLPIAVISLMCYGICTASVSDDASEDLEPLQREGLTEDEEEEEEEEEDVGQGQKAPMELKGPNEPGKEELGKKNMKSKKVD